MPVSSLLLMTQRACVRYLPGIRDVADIPYDLLRPILKKLDDPEQLHEIEEACPHIADADAELWKAFIARDVPAATIVEPKNKRSWWKLHRKLVGDERRAKVEQEEQLRAKLDGITQAKEANQTHYVDKVIPQASRSRREKAYVDGVRNPHVNGWGGSRTPTLQNAKRGKDIISAIRKQSSLAQQAKGKPLVNVIKPKVPGGASQITAAPASMVMDHQKYAPTPATEPKTTALNATPGPPRVFVKKTGLSAQDRAINNALMAEQAQKEERLRALTSGKPRPLPPAAAPSGAGSRAGHTAWTSGSSRPTPTAAAQTCAVSKAGPTTLAESPKRPGGVTTEKRMIASPPPAPMVRKRPAAPAPCLFMPKKKRIT